MNMSDVNAVREAEALAESRVRKPLLTLHQAMDDSEVRILAAAERSRDEMREAVTYAHGMAHGYFMAGMAERNDYLAASDRLRDIAAQAERTFDILAERGQGDPMLQRQVRHDAGTFPLCNQCGNEPRHIEARGSHSGEEFSVSKPTGTRHALECRCGARTPWLGNLSLAIARWGEHFAAPAADARPTPNVRALRPAPAHSPFRPARRDTH
ncbi:MAG TPA: hypothetical protein VFI32_10350 [Rhodanobacteraceae bacterium]|nr:hypothetical protein [Rhodanobacteraceae bacterium]